ncbi:hypothetical protein Bca52824_092206 [Brassica carinata]|uniref:Uncharacterized protein n=1 Tax=Brassica carinata TaxID=52824 RepID=A0A8X7NSQ7_BRACI|nr:hypothetical protein Bca52824_092206 [Brassica carinata]
MGRPHVFRASPLSVFCLQSIAVFKLQMTSSPIPTIFDVTRSFTRSNNKFRLSETPLSIRFNDGTSFVELTDSTSYVHWRTPTDNYLNPTSVYIKVLLRFNFRTAIRSTNNDTHGSQRVMLTLCIESYITVVISIFDALALAFYNKLESYATEPTIVLATSINPKIVGGQSIVNVTSGTHLYFDTETAVGKEKIDKLTGEGTYETTSSSKVVYAQKEALIVSELKQYVIAADPQEDEEVPDAQLPGVNALASNGAADENSNVAPHHPCLLIQLPKVNHQPNSNLIRARVDPRRHAWHKFT